MENISLELYKVFYYVAKTKNITRTSEKLLISQPAITQSIKKLEEQIGYKLFFRTKKGMRLTSEGEILFSEIKPSIECLSNCKNKLDNLNNETSQVIRIGGGTTLLKHNGLKGIKEFKKKYPNMKIEIKKDITKKLFEELENENLDLVFFNMPFSNIDTEKSKEIKIEEVNDAFIGETKAFSYLKDKTIEFSKLEKLPLVLQSEVSTSRKYLNSIFNKNHILLKNSYELSSYDLVISFVKAGLGIGFINKNHIEEELKNNELFEIKTNYNIQKRYIGIAVNRKKENNQYIKEFIEMIKQK